MTIIATTARAALAWPAAADVGVEGHYDVLRDAADAQTPSIPCNRRPIPAAPRDGRSALGGAGFGLGLFGAGAFGSDGPVVRYTTPTLPDGTYNLAVIASDAAGNESTQTTAAATLAGQPRAPAPPAADAYAAPTDTLTLAIALSPDDDAYA